MRINMTSDYAIRCLVVLGAAEGEMSSAEIAEKIGVTRPQTMNILRQLRAAGFVNSSRGAEGGYWLAKPTSEISLLDILMVMEDSVYINYCLDPEHGCGRHAEGFCPVRKYYQGLQGMVHESLGSMTLEKLLAEGSPAE